MPTHLDNKIRAVSDMIIAKLEKVEAGQWQRPWVNVNNGIARNISGRNYSGSNLLFLNFHTEEKGYMSPIYLTFSQAKEAGLQIKKGERSFPVFYSNLTITDKFKNKIDIVDFKSLSKEEQKECHVKSFLKAYDVFNIGQTNMSQVAPERYATLTNKSDKVLQNKYHNATLSSMLDNNMWVCPIELHGNKAYYNVLKDTITLPRPEQFNEQGDFFGTLLHEMAHSTGHKERLDRDLERGGDTIFRAREELIAELASVDAGMKLGVQKEISENNYAYVKSWIETARQDNKFVYKAIVDAVKASNYITEALGIKSELTEKIEQAQAIGTNIAASHKEIEYGQNTIAHNDSDNQKNDLLTVNTRFNEELKQQINGTLPKEHTYKLGNPSFILQAAGVPDLPIELRASRLSDKSMQENHPFALLEVKDLPKAIQNPMAVFRSATHIGSYVIMTEIEHEGKNYVVALQANKQKKNIEINDIRSVHYRRTNVHIANWINEGLANYVNKEKMIEWVAKQRYISAEVRQPFNHAAKVIQNFENPTILNINLYHSLNNKIMENSNVPKEITYKELQAMTDEQIASLPIKTFVQLAKGDLLAKKRIYGFVPIEALHEDLLVKKRISGFLPAEALVKLAKDEDVSVRKYVAGNPNISAELLERLAKDNAELVRKYVADNPNTSAELLERLAKDKEVWVRKEVAGHPNTSAKVLERLAKDKEAWVRQRVADNPNTSAKVLERLSKDKNTKVCEAVVGNPNTSAEDLEKMYNRVLDLEDAWELREKLEGTFRQSAFKVLKELSKNYGEELYKEGVWVRKAVAGHPNTSAEVLERLSKDKSAQVREKIAGHPNTSAELLERLSKDKEVWVRASVAQNPNTSAITLNRLAKDKAVRAMVTLRQLPKEITAADFCKMTAEQRASLPNNLTIKGDLDMGATLPTDLKDLKLPENLTIEGDLEISGSEIELKELPKNLTVTGALRGQFSTIKSLPNGLNVSRTCDFSHSNLESIGENVVIEKLTLSDDVPLKSVAGVKGVNVEDFNSFSNAKISTSGTSEYVEISKFNSNDVAKNIINLKNNLIMSEKNHVGNSYKTVTEKGTFYNFEVRKETIEKMEGVGKRNEIFLAIEPKNKVESERHPTHSVYAGDRHEQRELQLVLSKDALLKAPVDGYGNIKVFAASREKIGADLSNYSVALEQKDPE
ncbi:MAG: ssDNA-binding domain-containing protein, partial [Dysgonamonadaceae bacterium]|nr:ssDNA-binding domain-containing protein [Dysgonamonadaceae bacterium]